MQNRIKEIRKANNMSQAEFGKVLNVGGNYIYMLESGTKPVSDRIIKDICREFQINEYWLRTGEGKMQDDSSWAEDIMRFAMEVIGGSPNSTQAKFIKAISKLSPEGWEVLQQIADAMAENKKGPDESDPE